MNTIGMLDFETVKNVFINLFTIIGAAWVAYSGWRLKAEAKKAKSNAVIAKEAEEVTTLAVKQIETKTIKYDGYGEDIKKLIDATDRMGIELDEAKATIKELKWKVEEANCTIADLRIDLTQAQEKQAKTQQELTETRIELAVAQSQLTSTGMQLDQALAQYSAVLLINEQLSQENERLRIAKAIRRAGTNPLIGQDADFTPGGTINKGKRGGDNNGME